MRQFIVSSVPDKNGIISVSGKDFRYLRQVLRVKIGDMINVRLSDGTLSNTTVCNILENQKQIQLQICQKGSADESVTRGVQAEQIVSSNSSIEYWLFQFIPKASKNILSQSLRLPAFAFSCLRQAAIFPIGGSSIF